MEIKKALGKVFKELRDIKKQIIELRRLIEERWTISSA